MTWRAPDPEALWAALTDPPEPLSGGPSGRDAAEQALAPRVRHTPRGTELDVGWWLVRVEG